MRHWEIYYHQQDFDRAQQIFQHCLEEAEALAREAPTLEHRGYLAKLWMRLGFICWTRGDLEGALRFFEKGCRLRQTLVEEAPCLPQRALLSYSFGQIGYICQEEGRLDRAMDFYQKELEIAQALAHEAPTLEHRRDLYLSYGRLAVHYLLIKKPEPALEYAYQALELLEVLAQEPSGDRRKAEKDLVDLYLLMNEIQQQERKKTMGKDFLDEVRNHLEFMGYEVERDEKVNGARHPSRANMLFREFRGGVLFTSFFRVSEYAKENHGEFLAFVDELNRKATAARAVTSNDGDLLFEAWHPAVYDRVSFGIFMSLWDRDLNSPRDDQEGMEKFLA